MSLERPLPETDGLAAHFWTSVAQDRLSIQQCESCRKHQHYARPICIHCGSTQLSWTSSRGEGIVLSCTTVHRGPYDDIKTPYTVALIRLDEGVTILSHLINAIPDADHCDARVAVAFSPFRDGVKLPVFYLVDTEAAS